MGAETLRFLGRHVATAALDRGHDVATFTRGVSGEPPDGVRALHGETAARGHFTDATFDERAHLAAVAGNEGDGVAA